MGLFLPMAVLLASVLTVAAQPAQVVVSSGDTGIIASAPLAGWAIALLVVSSVLCALGVALIVFGLACPTPRRASLLAESELESEGRSEKHVRGELVVAGSVLAILALICLATTLAVALAPARAPYGPGVEVVVVAVYGQPAPGGGATQLMADVRLPDGSLRSVLVKSVVAAPGQRGYIAYDGMLVVYHGAYYAYGWYGYYGGGWAAIFLLWLLCSLVLLCACASQEPARVRYVEVYSEEDPCDRPKRKETPKEAPSGKDKEEPPLART